MQNPYAIERFIQEHNAHARAVAELQALQRKAAAERRRLIWDVWGARVRGFFRRPAGAGLSRERIRLSQQERRLAREGR